MSPEKLLEIQIELEALKVTRDGMIADGRYDDEAFFGVADEMRDLISKLKEDNVK